MIWCVFHLCDYWPWLLWRALSYDLEGWRSLLVATQLAQQHCRGYSAGRYDSFSPSFGIGL